MKKRNHTLIFILAILSTWTLQAQSVYEPGYFIDNQGQRTSCQIRNADWKNSPDQFRYRLSDDGEIKTVGLESVQEFGIDNITKYVRAMVNVDQSSDVVNRLSSKRNPAFVFDTIFLNVLVEGAATLYRYDKSNMKRFFYQVGDKPIEQLVYKRYMKANKVIASNNQFRQQLQNDLKCNAMVGKSIDRAAYTQREITAIITNYNDCMNSPTTTFANKKKDDLINLFIRPRFAMSSFEVTHIDGVFDTDFGTKGYPSAGLEFEYLIPFNRKKWSTFLELSYAQMKATAEKETDRIVGGKLISEVDYSALRFSLGVRHFFLLNEQAKIYIGAGVTKDYDFDSKISFSRIENDPIRDVDVVTGPSFFAQAGYRFNDKYAVELKYAHGHTLTGESTIFDSDYSTIAFILGYSLF